MPTRLASPRLWLPPLLAALALYGCWSSPGLAARWGVSGTGVAVALAWAALAGWTLLTALAGPKRGDLLLFTAAALVLRFDALALVIGRTSPGDPHWYLLLARHLLDGQGLQVWDPAMRARVWAEFPPAYPVLLAGWGAVFGLSSQAVLALSTLLDAGAAALIAALGRRLGSPRAGLAAGALYLIWPTTLFAAPLAQKESLELLLVLALAHGWLGARPGWRAAAAIGVPAALLALTQPGMAAVAGLFGLLVPVGTLRARLSVGVRAAEVAVLVMLPWWVRNALVFHAFVPLTSVGGLSLWVGENPGASGNWMSYPAAFVGLPELACSKLAGHVAWTWMTAHPADALRLNIAKFLRAVGVGQFDLTRLSAMVPPLAPEVTAALLPLSNGAQVLLLAAGSWAMTRRQPVVAALVLAVFAQFALFGVWFEFSERHRELLTPLLLLGIAMAAARVRNTRASTSSARTASNLALVPKPRSS